MALSPPPPRSPRINALAEMRPPPTIAMFSSPSLQMQADVAPQPDRTRDPRARRELDRPAACRRHSFNGFVDCFPILCLAIALRSERRDINYRRVEPQRPGQRQRPYDRDPLHSTPSLMVSYMIPPFFPTAAMPSRTVFVPCVRRLAGKLMSSS